MRQKKWRAAGRPAANSREAEGFHTQNTTNSLDGARHEGRVRVLDAAVVGLDVVVAAGLQVLQVVHGALGARHVRRVAGAEGLAALAAGVRSVVDGRRRHGLLCCSGVREA